MERIRIDLGKGVVLSAPIKPKMTVDEWKKMTDYINQLLEQNVADDKTVVTIGRSE